MLMHRRLAVLQIPLALAENSGLAPIESLSEVKAMQVGTRPFCPHSSLFVLTCMP